MGAPFRLLVDAAAASVLVRRRRGRRAHRRRPDRPQRGHRQQGRQPVAGDRGASCRRAAPGGRAGDDDRPGDRRRATGSRSRSAADAEVTSYRGVRSAPAGHPGAQPRVRRHAGRADHGDRHRPPGRAPRPGRDAGLTSALSSGGLTPSCCIRASGLNWCQCSTTCPSRSAEDVDLLDRVALPRRRHAHELADVGRARGQAGRDPIALGDQVLDGELGILQAVADAVDRPLEVAAGIARRRPAVRHEVLGDQLVDGLRASGDEDLGHESADHVLVAFQGSGLGRCGMCLHASVVARAAPGVNAPSRAVDLVRDRGPRMRCRCNGNRSAEDRAGSCVRLPCRHGDHCAPARIRDPRSRGNRR